MPDAPATRRSTAEALLDRAATEPRFVRDQAVALLAEALAESDLSGACFAEQCIAIASAALGDLDLLGGHAEGALALATTLDDPDLLAHALATRCAFWALNGDADAMRADMERGLAFATGFARSRLLVNSASMHRGAGRLADAEQAYREALACMPPDKPQRITTANNLAITLQGLGRLGEAATVFGEVMDQTRLRLPGFSAKAAMNVALLDLATGRVAEGLAAFDAADQQLREAGLDPTPSLVDRCRILLDLGLVHDAADAAMGMLASVHGRRGDHIDVMSALVRALLLAREWELARGLLDSDAARGIGRHSAELSSLGSMLGWLGGEVSATPPPAIDPVTATVVAADLVLRSDPIRARLLRSAGAQLPTDRSVPNFLPTDDPDHSPVHALLGSLVDAALAQDGPRTASLVSLCAKELVGGDPTVDALARIWSHRIERLGFAVAVAGRATDDATGGATDAVAAVRAGREIAAALEGWAATDDAELDRLVGVRRAVLLERDDAQADAQADGSRAARLKELEHQITARRVAIGARSRATGTRPARTAPTSSATTPTVIFQFAGGRLIAVLDEGPVGSGAPHLIDLGPASAATEAVRATSRLAQRLLLGTSSAGGPSAVVTDRWRRSLQQLDDLLLAPLGLRSPERLTVVGSAALADVTWGVLPSMAGVAVRWTETLDEPTAPGLGPQASVLLVGGPSLEHAGAELDAIAGEWPSTPPVHRVERLDGPDATAAALLSAMGDHDVVHVGAHGTMRRDVPLFGHLTLADGPLTWGEIGRSRRLPRCLVLSACHLGPGGITHGPPWPIASALAGRGCHSLIVSALPVSDGSTVAFMAAFHRCLRAGMDPSQALAAAHLDARARHDLGCVGFVEVAVRQ